jgi:hypothetical protein
VEFVIWVVEAELVIAIAGWARRVETSWDAAEWGPRLCGNCWNLSHKCSGQYGRDPQGLKLLNSRGFLARLRPCPEERHL